MALPIEEKETEIILVEHVADKLNLDIIKMQGHNDDGGSDAIVKSKNKKFNEEFGLEVRRKGYPNHWGRSCKFRRGWKTHFLQSGIFLNELTIQGYKDKKMSFFFAVDIKNYSTGISEIAYCPIWKSRIDELLNQKHREQPSTNSGVLQSVKLIPINWFKRI